MSRLLRDSFWQSELILLIAAVQDLYGLPHLWVEYLVLVKFDCFSTASSAQALLLGPYWRLTLTTGHTDFVEGLLSALDHRGTTITSTCTLVGCSRWLSQRARRLGSSVFRLMSGERPTSARAHG